MLFVIKFVLKTSELFIMRNYCCVPNCKSKRGRTLLHRFPKTEMGMKWLHYINCDKLRNVSLVILYRMFVCHRHFEKRFVNDSLRLKISAYPTLFTKEEIDSGIPAQTHENTENVTPDHDYLSRKHKHVDHNYCKPEEGLQTVTNFNVYIPKSRNNPPEKINRRVDNSIEYNTEIPTVYDAHDETCETSDINKKESDSIVENKDTFSWEVHTGLVNIQDEPDLPDDDVQETLSMHCDDDYASLSDKEGYDERWHNGFHCDNCSGDIIGFRYTCVQCSNFDLCGGCETSGAHAQHYVLRVPGPKPYNEIQNVLSRIRKYLMKELDPISLTDLDAEDVISVKSEVKSEDEDEVEQVNALHEDAIDYESIQDSSISSHVLVNLEKTDFDMALVNHTGFEQEKEQSDVIGLSNNFVLIPVSTDGRNFVNNTNDLEKAPIGSLTNTLEVNNSNNIFSSNLDELNPLVKFMNLPSSILLKRGETVYLQLPCPNIQHIVCVDGNS